MVRLRSPQVGREAMVRLKVLLSVLFFCGITHAADDTVIINEATFRIRLADGQEQMVYRGAPVFYKDSLSQWQKIDPNWKISGDTLAYVKTGVYAATVDTLGNVRVRFKGRQIGWKLQGLIYFDDSNKNRRVIRATSWKKPTLKGDSLIFPNIFPGVQYALRYHTRALIGYLKISTTARANLPAPSTFGITSANAWLCLVFKMDLSDLRNLFDGTDSVRWIDRFDSDNPIIIKHHPDSIWGLIPQEIIYTTDTLAPKPVLRKTFVKAGTDFIMIIGYPYQDFVNLPPGDVVYDDAVQIRGTTKIIDSWLDESNPVLNYGSSTANYFGKVGNTKARMVIQWDFSDIPGGATITAAVDSHYYNLGASCTNSEVAYQVKRITSRWVEGQVSWNYRTRNPDTAWTSAGGDFSDNIVSPTIGYPNGWISVSGFESAVQNWVDGTWNNYGCIWKHPLETSGNTCKVVYSSEDATNDTRLYVTYTPPSVAKINRRQKLVRSN